MNQTIIDILVAALVYPLVFAGGYFFITTKATILIHDLFPRKKAYDTDHIYWIYRYLWLIRLTDKKPIINAILLFQYDRLVDHIAQEIERTNLCGKNVLIISSAFGDVVPRIMNVCVTQKTRSVVISDLVENELTHVDGKLGEYKGRYILRCEDATDLKHPDGSFDAAVMFFLLHELPAAKKREAIKEATRVVKSGGKVILADFHRPKFAPLKIFEWLYFKTFEPYALEIWKEYAPARLFSEQECSASIKKTTYLQDNFQIVVAVKK